MSDKKPAVRERIAQDVEALYEEKIQAFFDEALGAQKKAWGTCDGCRKKVEVDVPDWNARAKVLEMLLNQGYGRPKAEEEESRKGFILHRSIVLPDADFERILELMEQHGVGSLRPLPDSGVEVVTHGETADPAPEAAEET